MSQTKETFVFFYQSGLETKYTKKKNYRQRFDGSCHKQLKICIHISNNHNLFLTPEKINAQEKQEKKKKKKEEILLLFDIFMFDLNCVRNAAAEHRSQFGKRT